MGDAHDVAVGSAVQKEQADIAGEVADGCVVVLTPTMVLTPLGTSWT
jgi:hypothetical protein